VLKWNQLHEVYGHFTIIDLCEAYGCFIPLSGTLIMQCVVIGYPTVSSVKVKLREVYGYFTILDLCKAYGFFIAHLVGMILIIIKVKSTPLISV